MLGAFCGVQAREPDTTYEKKGIVRVVVGCISRAFHGGVGSAIERWSWMELRVHEHFTPTLLIFSGTYSLSPCIRGYIHDCHPAVLSSLRDDLLWN